MSGGGGHSVTHVSGPRWLSIGIALVLGFAAIAAGITGWRGTVMSGHAVRDFTLSTQALNDANVLAQDSERSMNSQRQLFIDYRAALDAGDAAGALTIQAMMGINTRNAIEWWQAQPPAERPLSPFISANPQWSAPALLIDANREMAMASEHLQSANQSLDRSHNLEFVAALVTIAFLAGGLTGVFESHRARVALLSTGIAVLVLSMFGALVFW